MRTVVIASSCVMLAMGACNEKEEPHRDPPPQQLAAPVGTEQPVPELPPPQTWEEAVKASDDRVAFVDRVFETDAPADAKAQETEAFYRDKWAKMISAVPPKLQGEAKVNLDSLACKRSMCRAQATFDNYSAMDMNRMVLADYAYPSTESVSIESHQKGDRSVITYMFTLGNVPKGP